jgi:hypothetical protein
MSVFQTYNKKKHDFLDNIFREKVVVEVALR